jgi:hypothetical protein
VLRAARAGRPISGGNDVSLFWLKAVPWSAIISNAPVILDAAKKLVVFVRSKRAGADEGAPAGPLSATAPAGIAELEERIERLEQSQQEAAELLRSMAESNAQLAQAVEALRRRAVRNMRLAWLSLAGLVSLAAWALTR